MIFFFFQSEAQPEPTDGATLSAQSRMTPVIGQQPGGGGVILNKTKLEGSNTQIIVKQENNEIVIRIEADKGANQGNAGNQGNIEPGNEHSM